MSVKLGDVVRLKCGGRTMTVQEKFPDGDCLCSWFDGTKHEAMSFPETVLQAIQLVRQASTGVDFLQND